MNPAIPSPAGRDWGFRWRSREPSRLEGFSDAVFGFAVTLLVVSLEVPRTFDDLAALLRGVPAFAASFAILALIWHAQYVFFRRYALDDRRTLVLNLVLLFLVLVYVYPLKFLFSALFDMFAGRETLAVAGVGAVPMVSRAEWPTLMAIYGVGFTAVFGLFLLLYRHAHRCRAALGLSVYEAHLTRHSVVVNGIMAGFGVLSIALALLGRPAAAGWIYALTAPVQFLGAKLFWRGVAAGETGQAAE